MIDIQKYKSAMLAASLKDPMRAEYPPSWDADGIEEDYVEKRSEEIREMIASSPDDMAEMLQEFTGDEAGQLMFSFCVKLSIMMKSTMTLAPCAREVKLSLRAIIEEYADQQAKQEIENA